MDIWVLILQWWTTLLWTFHGLKMATNSLTLCPWKGLDYSLSFWIWISLWCFNQWNENKIIPFQFQNSAYKRLTVYALESSRYDLPCSLYILRGGLPILLHRPCGERQRSHPSEFSLQLPPWRCQVCEYSLLGSSRPDQSPVGCHWVTTVMTLAAEISLKRAQNES